MNNAGDNGEGQNGAGDKEAGGDGIFFDVFNKLVFDALGVGLESKNEAWEANADEI